MAWLASAMALCLAWIPFSMPRKGERWGGGDVRLAADGYEGRGRGVCFTGQSGGVDTRNWIAPIIYSYSVF